MARIVIVGPGRAGLALGLAASAAGHEIVALISRRPTDAQLAPRLTLFDPIPAVDFVFVAVSDDAIAEVAAQIDPPTGAIIVHMSGRTSVDVLARLGEGVGSFHPLMTLPSPEVGARALAGAGVAVTSRSSAVIESLVEFGESLNMRPFVVEDRDKAAYHAGASAASNYVVSALAIADELFKAAGLTLDFATPLVEASVANANALGAKAALTGPIVRGDIGTVRAQREAAQEAGVEAAFVAMARATASLIGMTDEMEEVLREDS